MGESQTGLTWSSREIPAIYVYPKPGHVGKYCSLLKQVYQYFGFNDYICLHFLKKRTDQNTCHGVWSIKRLAKKCRH